MHRRYFLKAGLASGVGALATRLPLLAAPRLEKPRPRARAASVNLPKLQLFRDPLPVPAALPNASSYTISMTQVTTQLHSQLPPTKVWAYNGQTMGNTIINASRGLPITVRWENN